MNDHTTSFVCTLTPEQCADLRRIMEERGWEFQTTPPYAEFRAAHDRVTVVCYSSGKLVAQGKGVPDFVSFILEPEVLRGFAFTAAAVEADAEEVTPHGGVDESGKGDFFGPLAVAAVYVDTETAPRLRQLGVCDSKLVKSSAKIFELAKGIRSIVNGGFALLVLKPETYNRLYANIGNLNRLLAWGHARVIENLLEQVPSCPRMLSDKFGNEVLIKRALMERGRKITLQQRTKAESDVAVAAASILAREAFLRGMSSLCDELRVNLPRGAGAQVTQAGRKLLAERGPEVFGRCAKLHFKTWSELNSGGVS
jgi:ribonuclease HIII